MPSYNNSKTQSKNGGRRRKQTKRKLRRGRKSRKVMRGGLWNPYMSKIPEKSLLYVAITNDPVERVENEQQLENYLWSKKYNFSDITKWYKDLYGENADTTIMLPEKMDKMREAIYSLVEKK